MSTDDAERLVEATRDHPLLYNMEILAYRGPSRMCGLVDITGIRYQARASLTSIKQSEAEVAMVTSMHKLKDHATACSIALECKDVSFELLSACIRC